MKRLVLCIVLALWIAMPVAAATRVWTDAEGGTMEAEFIRESEGEVSFLEGGKLITMRLDQLSERDQQVVRDLQAGKTVQDDALPVAPLRPMKADPLAAADQRPPAPIATENTNLAKTPRKKPIVASTRVWTDVYGNQMTAKFVRVFDGNVVLSRIGRMSRVRFYELTSADQEYVRELLTSQGQESLIPPMPPAGTFVVGPHDSEGPFSPNVPPRAPVAGGFPQQPQAVRRGPTELFQDLRERDAERRDLQMQALVDAKESREKLHQEHATDFGLAQEGSSEITATESAATRSEAASVTLERPVIVQAQKWFFLAVVVGGVIGVVSVVVFAAMTIASASSVAKQRQYR